MRRESAGILHPIIVIGHIRIPHGIGQVHTLVVDGSNNNGIRRSRRETEIQVLRS